VTRRIRTSLALTALAACLIVGCSSTRQTPTPTQPVATVPTATPEELTAAVNQAAQVMGRPQKSDRDYRTVVEALARYRDVKEAPVRLFELLGEANLYLAEFEQAEYALAEGLRRDLYSEKIRELLSNLNYVRGRLALEQRNFRNAREFFGKAIFNTPNDIKLVDNIAGLYATEGIRQTDAGQWRDGARVLLDAIDLKGSRPDSDRPLARALLETAEPKQALEAANRYLVLHPDDTVTLLVKANALRSLERTSEAYRTAKAVLELDPGHPEALSFIKGLETSVDTLRWVEITDAIEVRNWQRAQRLLEQELKGLTDGASPRAQKIYEMPAAVSSELNDSTKALMYIDNALVGAPDDVELSLKKAVILLRSQRLDEAKKVHEKLLVRHSDDPRVRLAMADYWIHLRLPGNAIPHLEALVSGDRTAVPREILLRGLVQLGTCYALLKQFDKAEEVWLMLADMEPENARVRYNLGLLYQRQHRYGRAIEFYEQACQAASLVDENFGLYLYVLAGAYRQNGLQDLYQETLEKVVQVCPLDNPYRRRAFKDLKALGWGAPEPGAVPPAPGSAEGLLHQADDAAQRGDLEQARPLYQRLLQSEPQPAGKVVAAALRGVAVIQLTRRDYDRAAALLLQSIELDATTRTAKMRLGEAFEALQLYEDAARVYQELLRQRDGAAQQVRFQYARALRGCGRYDEAVKALDTVVDEAPMTLAAEQAKRFIRELEPQLLEAPPQHALDAAVRRQARSLREVAIALAELGLRDRAREYIQRARRVGGEDIETMVAEARLLEEEGKRQEALNILSQALAKSPKDTRVLLQQATLLYKERRPSESEAILQQILQIDGTDFEAAAALADIYQASGRTAEARAVLERLASQGVPPQDAEKIREKLRLLSTL